MQVYIITDLEGVAGVCLFEQTRPPDAVEAELLRARRLLTGEVNAAVQGCLDGGAERVVVNDGHGGGFSILPEELHEATELVHGRERPNILPGLDESFDAVILLGYHAMYGTPTGILHHTQSSKSWAGYWINGELMGEIGQMAILAGTYGLPVIAVTGDLAACDEAAALLGPDLVTVAVKEGYSRHCARTFAPAKAREMIGAGCREALQRHQTGRLVPLYPVATPAHIKLELQTEALADGLRPARAVRSGPRTFEMDITELRDLLRF
ncbi:MAG: M55 family metallopeptidase [Armatimonadetes bacterium]|nr:M55 family metallopeptidase [Armatimonadota bacterium]